MIPFDVDSVPLHGLHLIEAGAGTGKTYTIAMLFLRLIVEQGLPVDQILVVTYTKAAAEELKTRIRSRLVWAKNEWSKENCSDAQLARLVESIGDRMQARRRVSDALIDFDRAAIFTIHGFCQRVLHHFAFETGHLFESELVQDAQPYIQETADDFWRRNISRAPAELASYILSRVKGPEELAGLFHRRRSPLARVIPPDVKPPLTAIRPWRETARQIQALWPRHRQQVTALLMSEGLNGRKYGVCAPDKKNPGATQRQIVVAGLAAAMDQWSGSYPPFKRFDQFSADYIVQATKKNQSAPRHPFFDLCSQALSLSDDLEQQLTAYWRYLQVRLLRQFRQRLTDKKRVANILFFDDLLLQVRSALINEPQPQLAQAIRTKFQAALVDEFQDTDALQYDIFIRLFGAGRCLFFMIGDPKQAIYSFRGADLFSYLRAKDAAGSQYTLTRNFRSTPALIQALNTLFGIRQRPFGYARIPYEAAVAAHPDPDFHAPPLRLWYLTRGAAAEPGQLDIARPLSQQEAVQRIVTAVAEEIITLLSDKALSYSPEDIAVLTRTHRQAQQIKSALAYKGVPAVLYSAGSVFDSREADELSLVLEAVVYPADPRRVRSALAGDLFGDSARTICDYMENPGSGWEGRWERFETYHHLWLQQGFYRMFNRLMSKEAVRQRLLSLPGGERRLTNILHLAELLHQAAGEHHLGPEGLLKWFTARRQEGDQDEDARKLRLESDARAVRIITTHKSKGLQFNIVFCPFTWAGAKSDDKTVNFHDPEHQDRPTLAIGPGIEERHRRLALEEELAENLRMLYVALTRARQRCYLVWGCIKGAELSAPAYLLHAPLEGFDSDVWSTALQRKMTAMSDAQLISELQDLARRSGDTIVVEPLPQSSKSIYIPLRPSPGALQRRIFGATIDQRWHMASFSAMTAEQPLQTDDLPDRDIAFETAQDQLDCAGPEAGNLFDFPKGARAGLFFHDLLEHWDFTNPDPIERRKVVAEKLSSHGFDEHWLPAVDHLLDRLAQTLLPATHGQSACRLGNISMRQRVNEMEFYFPLRPVSVQQLKQTLFERAGGRIIPEFFRSMERLNFAPMEGFMKGYMDMVFEHDGRYYLVDWKSNHLGDTWSNYEPQALKRAMAHDYYFLQYYLYVVALDQVLQQRVTGYSYEQHFGGVYYLFLRGIQAEDRSSGIYYDLPDSNLVTALKMLLIDRQAESSAYKG